MYIKLYLTEPEKLQLEELAAKKNISVSGVRILKKESRLALKRQLSNGKEGQTHDRDM